MNHTVKTKCTENCLWKISRKKGHVEENTYNYKIRVPSWTRVKQELECLLSSAYRRAMKYKGLSVLCTTLYNEQSTEGCLYTMA
jgi:hypothetical protein